MAWGGGGQWGGGGWGGGYDWEAEKRRKLAREQEVFDTMAALPPEEQEAFRRETIIRGAVTPLASVQAWAAYDTQPAARSAGDARTITVAGRYAADPPTYIHFSDEDLLPRFPHSAAANQIAALWQGSITQLDCDGIVNAANDGLWAGGGICGAIHDAAGPLLEQECNKIPDISRTQYSSVKCVTGDTVITKGYRLPAKHVLHTVGPTREDHVALAGCYRSTLDLCKSKGLRSVALCCVSTGIFGFPLLRATHRALDTVRRWLDDPQNAGAVQRVVFCVFLPHELAVYERLLPCYFPRADKGEPDLKALDGAPRPPIPGQPGAAPPPAATDPAGGGGGAAAAPPPQQGYGGVVWEYMDEGGRGYLEFNMGDMAILESMFAAGAGPLEFSTREVGHGTWNKYGDEYKYNLQREADGSAAGTQTNQITRIPRKVRRRLPDGAAAVPAAAAGGSRGGVSGAGAGAAAPRQYDPAASRPGPDSPAGRPGGGGYSGHGGAHGVA